MSSCRATNANPSPTIRDALRSYAELVAALEWLDAQQVSVVPRTKHLRFSPQPVSLLFIARDLGWPGLEEL